MSQKFSMKELECDKVVVFQDRAEIRRLIKTSIQKGENELFIHTITPFIDTDSVRVEGVGNASVLDVVCQRKSVEVNNVETNEKLKQLKLELIELETKQEQVRQRLDRILKQTNVLNEFANTISKQPSSSNKENNTQQLGSKENVDNFMSFIDAYSNRLESLDKQKIDTELELKNVDEKLRVTKENHDRLAYSHNFSESIEITILVETSQDKSDINLFVSYLVFNASWSPKYDIRVFGKEKSMIINYFGLITQSTGEDWNETKLSLSTAVPAIGGNVPELETQNLRIKQPVKYAYKRARAFPQMSMAKMSNRIQLESDDLEERSYSLNEAPIQLQTAQTSTSTVGSTSTFDIPRKSTIPSDNTSHKVSIGVLNLKPQFEYEAVPRKNSHAYIKAKVTNTSEYALLAGPANVFFDNNFVAKTDLKSYSPQEEFNCSLGVDPAIRIDYKPVKKYASQSGLLTKTNTTTYSQIIEIKNTSPNNAKLLLSDNLPLSTDDKIQVRLIEPVLKNQTNVRLNKANNIEFDLDIEPGKTEEITIKYSIDVPSDKEIEFF